MARLIDADALMGQLEKKRSEPGKQRYTEGFNDALMRFRSMIHSAPTIDAEPVRHGRWKVKTVKGVVTIFECSECRETLSATNDYFGAPTKHIAKIYPYCHCGAKMDGGGSNEG